MSEKRPQIIWQERFVDAVTGIPISPWFLYPLSFLVNVLFLHLLEWLAGAAPWGQVSTSDFEDGVWLPFLLFFAYIIRNTSSKAIDNFRGALAVSDSEYAELRANFLHMSGRTGWAISAFSILFAILLYFSGLTGGQLDPTEYFLTALELVYYFALGTIGVFTFGFVIHQLRWIAHIYRLVEEIDLLHLGPLSAFADLTLRTASPFVLANLLSYITNVVLVEDPDLATAALFLGVNTIIGAAAFVTPVWGIHTRLVAEKDRLSNGNASRINATLTRLHAQVDSDELDKVEANRHALAALLEERDIITKASTWPWETTNLRGFVSALLLPLFLWFVQGLLSRFVAF